MVSQRPRPARLTAKRQPAGEEAILGDSIRRCAVTRTTCPLYLTRFQPLHSKHYGGALHGLILSSGSNSAVQGGLGPVSPHGNFRRTGRMQKSMNTGVGGVQPGLLA